MKDYLANLVKQSTSPLEGRNLAREYLQARILAALQRTGAMIPLAFHGGTALRYLFSHGRYSEDLDFALEGNRQNYDFRSYLHTIRSELTPEGYQVEIKVNGKKPFIVRSSVFPDCCLSWDFHHNGVKCWQSKLKWIPILPKALGFPPPLCVGFLCFNFIIMTKLPYYLENCMPFCSELIPKDVIYMICFGI